MSLLFEICNILAVNIYNEVIMKKESAKENDWLIHILKEDIQNGKNEKKEEKNKK